MEETSVSSQELKRDLFESIGFELSEIVPTDEILSIIEGIRKS